MRTASLLVLTTVIYISFYTSIYIWLALMYIDLSRLTMSFGSAIVFCGVYQSLKYLTTPTVTPAKEKLVIEQSSYEENS